MESLLFLGLLIAVFYFLLIRPQKRRVEAHRQLVESVEVGDEVVTIGGMHGTVRAVEDDAIHIEVAEGTVLRFIKSAVARRVTDEADEAVQDDDVAAPTENGEGP